MALHFPVLGTLTRASMPTPPRAFRFFEGYAIYRPAGQLSFDEAVATISEGLRYAASRQIERLLVDSTKLTGFPAPSVWQRFWMAEEWAAVQARLRLAVVARPDLIDPSRFGVTVALNRGLVANVFSSEAEAIRWLLNDKPASDPQAAN